MQQVQIHGKIFVKYIEETEIQVAVRRIAGQIEKEYADDVPLFLVVLNGAVFFASDLDYKANEDVQDGGVAKVLLVYLTTFQVFTDVYLRTTTETIKSRHKLKPTYYNRVYLRNRNVLKLQNYRFFCIYPHLALQ